ncbi:MAG: helix-turn-helix domain-containing protein [Acutalibacteraceae bacterium]|nr:helix-turn-helix domain-containing protein [Acutalibacteraceae bacterium]
MIPPLFIGGMNMPTENKMTYTVEEIQKILGVCKSSAYSLVKKGEFRCVKIGSTYRISKSSFDEWLNQPKECK